MSATISLLLECELPFSLFNVDRECQYGGQLAVIARGGLVPLFLFALFAAFLLGCTATATYRR